MGHPAADPLSTKATRSRPLRLLILCTGNSCRSQMAEGFSRALRPREIEVYSAGTQPSKLNLLAVRAMAEAGVDIGPHRAKSLDELSHLDFDAVLTVCDSAHKACPRYPKSAAIYHHSFDDPPALAHKAGSDDEAMPHYRRVRDEINVFLTTFLPRILSGSST